MLSMNAEYLCERYENYTLTVLFRRGIPLVSLVTNLISVLYGGFLLIRNQKHKTIYVRRLEDIIAAAFSDSTDSALISGGMPPGTCKALKTL